MSKKLLGMLLSSMMFFSNLTTIQVYAEEDTNTGDENTQEVTETENDGTEKKGETEVINSEEDTGEEVTADTEQSEETEIEEEYLEKKEQQNTGNMENKVVSDGQEEEHETSGAETEETESKETNAEEKIIESEEETEEKEEPSYAGELEGQAYAVLEDDGDMIFFRSNESYTSNTKGTFVDINRAEYTGTVYSGFESASYSSSIAVPWFSDRRSIYTVTVAPEQTIKPKSTAYWFASCENINSLDPSGFDTSNVTTMRQMFSYCTALTSLDLRGFNTSNVTDMNSLFYCCWKLETLNLSSFDTSNVINMGGMFWICTSLTSLDLSGFDTSNVTNMMRMFSGCKGLTSLDLSGFDTSKVKYMTGMFEDFDNVPILDLSGFDTSNVIDMSNMFYDCDNLTVLDLSGFDTSNITDMSDMFYYCHNLSEVKLGKGFTNWSNSAYLPKGNWSNRAINMSLTEAELYRQFPQHANSYAGTWIKNAITGITISPAAIAVPINQVTVLNAQIIPITANNKNVIWTSSNESIATVDENGKITAVRLGTVMITATTEDGGYTATCKVTVIKPVTGITLDKEEVILKVSEDSQLTALITPEDASIKKVIWSSSDYFVATVDNNGKITAAGRGTATITATTENGGYTATCEVTVIQPVTGISLDKEELTINVNETADLITTVQPDNANNKTVTWTSSDDSIATVDGNGKIAAVGRGTVTITAITEDGGYTATCEVTVIQPATGITLDKEEITINAKETAELTAIVEPDNANNKNVTWTSSDRNIAIVDENGKITAVGRGTTTIAATTEDGGNTATCEVTVIQPVTGIVISKEKIHLNVNETAKLTATVEPDNANNKNISWTSSDRSIATVDANGKITAFRLGTATITATTEDGGYKATCEVTVLIKPESIEVGADSYQLYVGDAIAIHPIVLPKDASKTGLVYISSNPNVVEVSSDGIIEAISKGTATITVKDTISGLTDTTTVSVQQRSGGSAVIDRNCQNLWNAVASRDKNPKNGAYQYAVSFTDRSGGLIVNEADTSSFRFYALIYESVGLCRIDMDYDASAGTAEISITDSSQAYSSTFFSYTANLHIDDVYNFDITKTQVFTIERNSESATPDNMVQIQANIMLKKGFSIWEDYLAAIGISCRMRGIGFGSMLSSSSTYYPSIKSITVDKTQADLIIGETMNFTAIPNPSTAMPNSIRWVNNNPSIIELYGDGEFRISVKALAKGTATVDLYVSGSKKQTIQIIVKNPVEIMNKNISLPVGDSGTVDVELYGYMQNQLIWSTDNTNIISIDNNGNISAKKVGTAVITVKTNDKLFSDQCTVTVVKKIHPSSVLLDKEAMPLRINETFRLFAVVRPDNASNKNIIWTSENYEVASVNSAGRVTGIKPGVTNITATTEDGGYTDSCKVTVLFDDVTNPEQYYYNAVYWAVENNITQGMGPTTFKPGGFCKRYQFVLFLWRQAGCPEPRLKLDPFTDVLSDPNKAVYEKAVLWAAENEITTGTSPTTFDPYAPLTRGQVVTFLYRAAGQPFFDNWNNPFVDLDSSKYYYTPVLWAVENNITTGLNATHFGPTDTCTRGQTVTFLHRQFVKE